MNLKEVKRIKICKKNIKKKKKITKRKKDIKKMNMKKWRM